MDPFIFKTVLQGQEQRNGRGLAHAHLVNNGLSMACVGEHGHEFSGVGIVKFLKNRGHRGFFLWSENGWLQRLLCFGFLFAPHDQAASFFSIAT